MKQLYLTVTELLKEVPQLRWVDFNDGQLQEEQPSIAYPCALVDIDLPSCENIHDDLQQVRASFNITLVFKSSGETNTNAPKSRREFALNYFDTVDAVFEKLQGYGDDNFYPFERTSVRTQNIRRGLKVIELSFSTSWTEDCNSKP